MGEGDGGDGQEGVGGLEKKGGEGPGGLGLSGRAGGMTIGRKLEGKGWGLHSLR